MYKNSNDTPLNYLREIKSKEKRAWGPQRQSLAIGILESFLRSKMEMAEVELDRLPDPVHRKARVPSSKQDSFASSFYAWKRKTSTKESMKALGIQKILLIRRGGKIALRKRFLKLKRSKAK